MRGILLTGSSGMLGSEIAKAISTHGGYKLTNLVRGMLLEQNIFGQNIQIKDLAEEGNFSKSLLGKQVVIHAAGHAHHKHSTLEDYRRTNVMGSLNLARHALDSGVKQFIYISSIKVNGEFTDGVPFTYMDKPSPMDSYGVSKYEAEQELQNLLVNSGMNLTIIRPPLIYSQMRKGNFPALINLALLGCPIPTGSISNNRKSFVYVGNLVELIIKCIMNECAFNKIFLVSDGEDLSTSEWIRRIGLAFNRKNYQFPVNLKLLKMLSQIARKELDYQKLTCSLAVDIEHTKQKLIWMPSYSVDNALIQIAETYKS